MDRVRGPPRSRLKTHDDVRERAIPELLREHLDEAQVVLARVAPTHGLQHPIRARLHGHVQVFANLRQIPQRLDEAET